MGSFSYIKERSLQDSTPRLSPALVLAHSIVCHVFAINQTIGYILEVVFIV